MKAIVLTVAFQALFLVGVLGQGQYVSYMTGDPEDSDVDPEFGLVLMGGAGENDEAMKWFLERANGGDVVVLRTTGTDGYNDYFYSDLGVDINSVETIVFNSSEAANDPYVLEQVQNAEAIWFAGGNQWTYISFWKDTQIEDAINNLINMKTGPVGGISAGMAIMGGSYFSAENNTVYSEEALENPYNQYMALGHSDFIEAPFLETVITDTHYDDPDRKGRHATFLARVYQDTGAVPGGIACDEYAAACIDEEGRAWCYGEAPEFDDYVYFLRPDCDDTVGPEVCTAGQPLTWNNNGQALKVLRINAELDGQQYLDLSDWQTHSGGEWFDWSIQEGVLNESTGVAPDCALSVGQENDTQFVIYPNPANDVINLKTNGNTDITIINALGELVLQQSLTATVENIDVSHLPTGFYQVKVGSLTQSLILQ